MTVGNHFEMKTQIRTSGEYVHTKFDHVRILIKNEIENAHTA